MSLKVAQFEFNMFGETTYIVYDTVSREAAVIDPGMINAAEEKRLDTFVEDNNLCLKHIINTHLHIDHSFGINHLRARYGLQLSASPADAFLASRIADQARMFHLPVEASNVTIDRPMRAGDTIRLGSHELHVIEVPGHSPGGLSLYAPDGHFVITGDSLFRGSIGRTDLPGGDHSTLICSVTDRLLTLPDDTTVYPGHGPATTIGDEKRFNPYL